MLRFAGQPEMKLSASEQTLVKYICSGFALTDAPISLPRITDVDWVPVCESARGHRLEAVLYRSLRLQNLTDGLPANLMDELRNTYHFTLANNLVLQHELAGLLERFGQEEIQTVLLKGCALAEYLYQDIGLRPMVDLDVLVPKAAIPRVSRLLEARGYVPYSELVGGFQQSFENEQAYLRESPTPVTLDVHWHLLGESYYFERVPMDWFWQRTTEIRVGDQAALVFSTEAQLLYLISHFLVHHKGEGLGWSLDLAFLLSRYRSQIEWVEAIEAARRFGLSQIVRKTLEDVSQVWAVSIPDEAREMLEHIRPNVAERLSFVLFTARHVEARTLWDGLGMPSFRRKLEYLRHIVFPSKSYMQMRYSVAHSHLIPVYYCWRLVKGISMLLRSLLSIVVNPGVVFHPEESHQRADK